MPEYFLLTEVSARDIISSLLTKAAYGALAQLVARLNGIQKVRGSTPLCSTTIRLKTTVFRLFSCLFLLKCRLKSGKQGPFNPRFSAFFL